MRKLILTDIILIFICLIVLFFSLWINIKTLNSLNTSGNNSYVLAWPGMLPDNKFYKIKVLRNKIIEKIIRDPLDKVTFDLLMADKTINASQILVNKGEISLAKDTALKGENYYSSLVQDYNKALLNGERIPVDLDRKITLAAVKHREVFLDLALKVNQEDKKSFLAAENFSVINYNFILGLRKK